MTCQVQHRHLHHALVEVGCPILDDLHCHHFLCLKILTLDDLTKCALPKDIKNEVSIPVEL